MDASKDQQEIVRLKSELAEERRSSAAKFQELEKQKNFLKAVIDAVEDPIFVKDADHRWVLLNKKFCELMGRSEETLMNKSDFDFFPEAEAKVFWKKDDEVLSSGEGNVNEESFSSPVAGVRTIATKKSVFVNSADGKKYLAGVIRDVSEIKAAQTDRERLIEKLQEALGNIKTLSGLVPICSCCKKIRNDEGFWQQVEIFLNEHLDAEFSHGICPDCMKERYGKEGSTRTDAASK